MILRAQQIAAMEEAANLAFERKLAIQLSADKPAQMQEFVHRSLVRGRRHGIASQSDLAEFCALLWEIGGPPPAADEPKWLRRILTDPKLDGSAKVLQMRTRATESAGGEAV
jgi:hypothetical protein